MTDYVKAAVLGTEDYHAVMRQAAKAGLQRQGGYIAQTVEYERRDFTFLISSMGKVGFSVQECEVIRLSPDFWIEMVFPAEDQKLRYPNVIVFHEFVVFCWSDAMEINYEWCQLEVSRNALIEMWSKQP